MANASMMKTMAGVTFQQTQIINASRLITLIVPQFSRDQLDVLNRDPTVTIHSLDNQAWISLMGWIDAVTTAIVQCRRSGLTVRIPRRKNVAATLLAEDANFPAASLAYRDKTGAQKQRSVEIKLDSENGFLQLQLNFDGELYDEVLTAMTTPNTGITLAIDYAHSLQIKVPASAPVDPRIGIAIRFRPGGFARPDVIRATAAPAVRTDSPAAPVMKSQTAAFSRADMNRVFVPPPPPPSGDTIEQHSFKGQVTLPLAHTRDDVVVFPDLPRQSQNGWGQVPGKIGQPPPKPALHFRDSGRSDTFYYLPTRFKLGYYFEQGPDSVQTLPPLRVELYHRDSDGSERIKATLVALPSIDAAERQALRSYLDGELLLHLQPFINLEPRSGITAEFVQDFTYGQAADPLPVQIVFEPLEVVPNDRLKLSFDMPADQYPIFCELMKFGIFGRVKLSEPGLEEYVLVRLQLDDMTTNMLRIEQAPPPPPANPDDPPGPATLSLTNLLNYPVQVPSLTLNLLDKGDQSGMILDAENLQLLPGVTQLPAQSDAGSTVKFPFQAQRLVGWDTVVVELGQLKVLGGTADEWLARVNRDPSLQQHEFKVQLQILPPPSNPDRVQVLRLRLFKDGDATVRSRQDLALTAVSPVQRVTMTLEELMGEEGKAPTFSIEYETLAVDGTRSPSQRVAVSSEVTSLALRAMVPTANTIFTVESEGDSKDVTAAELAPLIDQLRNDRKHWEIFTREPKSATAPADTPSEANKPPTQAGPASGPSVTIVTDLAKIAFEVGTLTRIFVVLKADQDSAPQSSFSFDAGNHDQINWTPSGVTIPPFRYQITYLYPGNKVAQSSGTSSNLTLILDPPPAPA